jgi:hypothetical protein
VANAHALRWRSSARGCCPARDTAAYARRRPASPRRSLDAFAWLRAREWCRQGRADPQMVHGAAESPARRLRPSINQSLTTWLGNDSSYSIAGRPRGSPAARSTRAGLAGRRRRKDYTQARSILPFALMSDTSTRVTTSCSQGAWRERKRALASPRRSRNALKSGNVANHEFDNVLGALFRQTRSALWEASSETLPFSCPLEATRSGKRQQGATQSEGRKSADSTRDEARSGNVQQAAAKSG